MKLVQINKVTITINFNKQYIVYVQVEFPEARIYEDTLNILLFEGQRELAILNHELLKLTTKPKPVKTRLVEEMSEDDQ